MDIVFPKKLKLLFQSQARYIVLYGGRGGAKSWGVARYLLLRAAREPIRVLCAREFQNSIKDSVLKLLADQIEILGLSSLYDVQTNVIKGSNGSEFNFEGLRHNVTKIKSYEGVDVCWIEEAQNVCKSSWDVLVPTIRKENSQIIVTFNPSLESDETYQRFVKFPPTGAEVMKIGWQDNPWFPDVLKAEMDDLKQRNMDDYLHIWEGHCKQVLDGAVYANEIRVAQDENRITRVPIDTALPIQTFWDLGWADNTSIWVAQTIPGTGEIRAIDFYQNSLQPITHYAQWIDAKGYRLGTHWLPHDSRHHDLHGRTAFSTLADLGLNVQETPNLSIEDGISAARSIFGRLYFDEQRCADGINALRHYRYDIDEQTGAWSRRPLHDAHSHAADALRYLAVAIEETRIKPASKFGGLHNHWMG